VGELWFSDFSFVGSHLVLEFSKLFGVGTFGESDNFLKDLNIRFVDGLGTWDPVFVDSGG
jgi:hypothetical protein